MKCLTDNELDRMLLETSDDDPVRKKAAERHFDACPACRERFDRLRREQERWSDRLFAEALPSDFTERLLKRLEDEETEEAHERLQVSQGGGRTEHGQVPMMEREQGKGTGMPLRSDRWKPGRRRWIAAVLLLLLLFSGTFAALSSPTVAELVRTLFSRDNVDIGLLNAQEYGLVQHPGIRVKDKGYTVQIDEAVADPTRVIVALQLFDPDGKHDRNRLTFGSDGRNSIAIKDESGKTVEKMYDYGYTKDFYYMIAFFPEPLQADKITIEGRLSQLGNEMQNIPFTDGSWNFDFTIDMKEAKAKTTIVPLQGEYTSPDGMTVRLKRLTRMVQGVRLELETELSAEALARSPGDWWEKQGLKFHFETMAGEEIHSVNNNRKFPNINSLMTFSEHRGDKPGLMQWSYTFQYLPPYTPYRFVLDGYFISEKDGTRVDFEPAKLEEQPLEFRSVGDVLTLRKFTIEPDLRSKRVEGALHVDGKLINEYDDNEWVVIDKQGRTYNADGHGGSGTNDGYLMLNGGRPDVLFQFRIRELTTVPDQLAFVRTIMNKVYTNVDWSVVIDERKAE